MARIQEDEVEAARTGAGSFPRAIPEDNVEYYLYLPGQDLTDTQVRDRLRAIQTASTALVKNHLRDYIWEQDSFSLNLGKQDSASYLSGRSSYGDSVEDEWVIVWLLVELSKKFEDAWIRVADADGEFLLIEAANALPRWLNPEIADNRVWINKGHLCIIPKTSEEQQSGSLTLNRALKLLGNKKNTLMMDTKIEEEAFFRLKKYPAGFADSLHHALVKIPRKVAFLLQKNITYISTAIEAFYLRDPIALKPFQTSSSKDLLFPPVDLVTSRIKFTKIGFAKVRSQEFPYPPTWPSRNELLSQDSKLDFQAEMGMKLTCGFEMLLSDPQNKDKKVVREIKLVLEDLEAGEDKLPTDEEIKSWGTVEDSDSWLDIDYQDFEKELAGKGMPGAKNTGFGSTGTQEKLKKMVSRFEDLMAEDNSVLNADDMDEDNDSDVESPGSDDSSHGSVEEDFNEMMREMLDMSKETMDELMGNIKSEMESKGKGKMPQVMEEESDDEEDEEIRKLSAAMEAELRASGALKLDVGEAKTKSIKSVTKNEDNDDDQESSDDEYLDEDYSLAKNMLESFKSQAGVSGPAGNLMGMLGVQMPRDEHDGD